MALVRALARTAISVPVAGAVGTAVPVTIAITVTVAIAVAVTIAVSVRLTLFTARFLTHHAPFGRCRRWWRWRWSAGASGSRIEQRLNLVRIHGRDGTQARRQRDCGHLSPLATDRDVSGVSYS